MTRDELIETIDELAGNSDIFAPPISDRLRDAAAMFRRDGETITALEAERDNLRFLVKDICEEWNEDCDPECDSIGHTGTCKAVDISEAKRAMREENERLQAERDTANRSLETLEQIAAELLAEHNRRAAEVEAARFFVTPNHESKAEAFARLRRMLDDIRKGG